MKYAIIKNNELFEKCNDIGVFVGKIWQEYQEHIDSTNITTPFSFNELKIIDIEVQDEPDFNPELEKLSEVVEEIIEDKWIIKKEVIPLSSEELETRRIEKAKQKRINAENNATIQYKNNEIKADDKAVNILSAYIQSGAEEVPWKCIDGSWLVLTQADMSEVLRLIALKKKEIFEQEFMETI